MRKHLTSVNKILTGVLKGYLLFLGDHICKAHIKKF